MDIYTERRKKKQLTYMLKNLYKYKSISIKSINIKYFLDLKLDKRYRYEMWIFYI